MKDGCSGGVSVCFEVGCIKRRAAMRGKGTEGDVAGLDASQETR